MDSERKPAAAGHLEGPPVVAIGSSAGGFEAIRDVLSHLPDDFGMAVVLVQHLDPKHESQLASLFGRATTMPVTEAKEGDEVEAGHIYVIPADSQMVIRERTLHLLPRSPNRGQPTTIDVFMRSLAEDLGDQSIGVVLSGTLSDGTAGLREIKAAGGFTFAQDLDSAKYHEMPRSAIAAGHVDFVMPPAEIADELARLGTCLPLQPLEAQNDKPAEGKEVLLSHLFHLVRNRTGVDFSLYKRSTLERRIRRRMTAHRVDSLVDYVDVLREQPDEARHLYEEVLIHVTRFFRDDAFYKELETSVFPRLVDGREPGSEIRLWVAGCATGEEAYSIAILLHRFQQQTGTSFPVQIFATDLSDGAIATARAGIYPDAISQDVEESLLKAYFNKAEGGYSINKLIRSMCVFAVHDVTRDPPFSNIDLVSCRNVLIYMEPPNQRRVLAVFHYALRPEGYLALGTSEGIGRATELFAPDGKGQAIFRRLNARSPLPSIFSQGDYRESTQPRRTPSGETPDAPSMKEEIQSLMLDEHTAPAFVVDDKNHVVHFRGDSAAFIHPGRGEASLSIHRILRDGLATEVATLVNKARANGAKQIRAGVRFAGADGTTRATLHAYPLRSTSNQQILVVVEREYTLPKVEPGGSPLWWLRPGKVRHAEERIEALESELAQTRITMRSLVEDYETTTEELRCANEEALSSNEELQSTNEELETAKEEAQSTNEELRTLNEELIHRSAEVQKVNNDLTNLLHSVEMPIVMLSRSLVIRRFTPQAQRLFRLIPTDLGRPITDIQSPFEGVDLKKEIQAVLDDLQRRKVPVTGDNEKYSLEIHPYRTNDNQIDGTVLVVFKNS